MSILLSLESGSPAVEARGPTKGPGSAPAAGGREPPQQGGIHRGFAFIFQPGDLVGVERDQCLGCPAPRTAAAPRVPQGMKLPLYPPRTQPPSSASTGYAVH